MTKRANGRFPYPFSEKRDPIDVILNEAVVALRRCDASIPQPLAAVIDTALAKNPKDRYQNAGAFLEALKKTF